MRRRDNGFADSADKSVDTGLDDLVVQVYGRILRERATTVTQLAENLAVSRSRIAAVVLALTDLRLVREVGDGPGCLTAMSPDVAELELIGPLEQRVHTQQRELSALRTRIRALAETYDDVRKSWRRDEVVLVADTAAETRKRIADAARHCRYEVLTMQPGGGRDPGELEDATPRDLDMLDRDVRMRIIYQHTARTDIPTRKYVGEVTARGGEVRTSNETFDRLIIFDREVAFVPHGGTGPESAAIVYEPAIVALLYRIFDNSWRSATVFDPGETAYGETLDDVRTTIVELLAAGLKDDVIARRLGMSARTCRRHVSAIMAELGAASRFQAGVAAAHAGLLPPPVRSFR